MDIDIEDTHSGVHCAPYYGKDLLQTKVRLQHQHNNNNNNTISTHYNKANRSDESCHVVTSST